MAKDNDPNRLSPIALRMKEDLQLSGKGERTQESYLRMLRKFTEFLNREPDSATEDDLRNYLLYIKNQRLWSNSTINVAYCALKFFFSKTCPRDWPTLKKLKIQPELKLPTVLTIDEVHILLKIIEKPSMFASSPSSIRWASECKKRFISKFPISTPNGWLFTSIVVRGQEIGSCLFPCRRYWLYESTMQRIETQFGSSRPKARIMPKRQLPKFL